MGLSVCDALQVESSEDPPKSNEIGFGTSAPVDTSVPMPCPAVVQLARSSGHCESNCPVV